MRLSIPTKVILPVAGLGTRLYPLTLHKPKALVEVRGKPLLEYIMREVHESGFLEAYLVMSPEHRGAFKNYLAGARKRFPHLRFATRIQEEAFGNGQAILKVADLLGREPFAVRYCDDLLFHEKPALASLTELFQERQATMFALERIPRARAGNYGVVSAQETTTPRLHSVHAIFEKHIVGDESERASASDLTVVGAYILVPHMLHHLEKLHAVSPPLPDALLLTAAFHHELARGGEIYGWEFPGTRIDCGTHEGLKKAHLYLRK